ncbi:MAG: hypothetical protein J6K72_10245 [Clostridia bacterium]|nr:hypothetical protein [Clostridia bacterium]
MSLFFSFVSKEKNQKKTAICGTVVGGWPPNGVQPHAAVHKSNNKGKPASRPSTWVEAGFLLLLFFSLKRKVE